MRKALKLLFVLTFLFSLGGSVNSCKSIRSCNELLIVEDDVMNMKDVRKKTRRIQRKSGKKAVKSYNKKYKNQTKIQSKPQRKMITKSRRKPKNMKSSQRFFLFRWLGI